MDLDSIFAPYHSGWPQAALTEYEVAGVDINQRYAPLSTGSSAPATGYKKAGADLNTIFAAYGSTGVQVATQPSNVSGSSAAGRPSGTVTSSAASCAGTKGGGSYTYEWFTSGCTATSPGSASTTFYATVDAQSTVNATAFCRISDGTTTVNTNTIAVTLTNTSLAYTISITAGVSLDSYVGYGNNSINGAFGTLNSNTSGIAVVEMSDTASGSEVFISGDLGASYLNYVQINGRTVYGSAASYSYSSTYNISIWTWGGGKQFGFANGSTYQGLITHN